jgi:hypothetical protein
MGPSDYINYSLPKTPHFSPEDGDSVSPKCWYLPMSPYSVRTQKNIIFEMQGITYYVVSV